jgi:L-asparaginase/Glu-tRNA(Gln) amidotransferase subunit D
MTEIPTTHEHPSDYVIPILGTFPGMNPFIIEAFAPEGTQAVILESNGHASPASEINQVIKKMTDKGVPVIVLADVYGKNHGITHVADEPQQDALNAGAFFLETIG